MTRVGPRIARPARAVASAALLLGCLACVDRGGDEADGRSGAADPPNGVVFDEPVLDLGVALPWARLTGRLRLTNGSRETRDLALKASCGCSSLKPRRLSLAAGETAEVAVEVGLPGESGKGRDVTVSVSDAAGGEALATSRVLAVALSAFSCRPSRISASESREGVAAWSRGVSIGFREVGGTVFGAADVEVSVDGPFAAEVIERSESGVRVAVTASEPLAEGRHFGALKLRVLAEGSRPETTDSVPILVSIEPRVTVVPLRLRFRQAKSEAAPSDQAGDGGVVRFRSGVSAIVSVDATPEGLFRVDRLPAAGGSRFEAFRVSPTDAARSRRPGEVTFAVGLADGSTESEAVRIDWTGL